MKAGLREVKERRKRRKGTEEIRGEERVERREKCGGENRRKEKK